MQTFARRRGNFQGGVQVVYLTIFTFVTPTQFFYIIAGGAFVSWLLCIMWLKEPESGFADEYQVSSVDLQIEEEERRRQAAATS